jgi:hypothetical protein
MYSTCRAYLKKTMWDIKLLPKTFNNALLSRLFERGSVKKMNIPSRDRKNCSALQFSALILLGYSLAGCASPVSPAPTVSSPREVHGVPATVRVIISFQRPTADNRLLFAAISDACQCTPVFFRTYGGNALIYVIALPQGQNFAAFEKALMRGAPQLGIVSIEQDSVEHF